MSDVKHDFTILFVEDEEDTRKNYVQYLKRYFKEVYEASNGESAYQLYKEKKPNIMIIDIHIPKMNGLELLEKIREKDHTTRALMLTAHSDKNLLLEASSLKLTQYLVKPITGNELKQALDLAISEIKKFQVVSIKHTILKDNYSWNHDTKELYYKDTVVELTSKEKKVFELLVENPNITLSYDQFIIHVWDSYEQDRLNALKMCIKKLRKKLPQELIQTVYSQGYKLIL